MVIMEIRYRKSYQKDFQKLPAKIKVVAVRRIQKFIDDPFDPQLNNHALKGVLSHFRSINITGDYRAIFRTLFRHLVGEYVTMPGFLADHSGLCRVV